MVRERNYSFVNTVNVKLYTKFNLLKYHKSLKYFRYTYILYIYIYIKNDQIKAHARAHTKDVAV